MPKLDGVNGVEIHLDTNLPLAKLPIFMKQRRHDSLVEIGDWLKENGEIPESGTLLEDEKGRKHIFLDLDI